MDRDSRKGEASCPKCAGDLLLLTVPEVAELLRLTPKGVYAMVEARRLPHVKISNRVRFLRADVLAFLTNHRVSALEQSR